MSDTKVLPLTELPLLENWTVTSRPGRSMLISGEVEGRAMSLDAETVSVKGSGIYAHRNSLAVCELAPLAKLRRSMMSEFKSNSKPLRWDEDGVVPSDARWAMELQAGEDESRARAKLLADLGEVDECFIHVTDGPPGTTVRYTWVTRAETDGRKEIQGR